MGSDYPPDPSLCSEDADRLDALVEAGFVPEQVLTAPDPRLQRLIGLLSKLDGEIPSGLADAQSDPSESGRSLLVDVTMARVLRQRDRDLAGRIEPARRHDALNAHDAAAIDCLIEAGWDDSGPNLTVDAARAERAAALLRLLEPTHDPIASEQRDSLIEATLARVQSGVDESRKRWRLDPVRETSGRSIGSFRLTDLGAVAAMLLIGTAILWPILGATRSGAMIDACAMNMQQAGVGFGLFAADHRGEMPRVQENPARGVWWNVGDAKASHSANLYTLARQHYVFLGTLSCPGNPLAPTAFHGEHPGHDWRSLDEVSYSLQLYHTRRPLLNDGRVGVLMADKSPIVARAKRGERFDSHARSRNHTGRGQNVLLNDGSVLFLADPYLPGSRDNLWLPRHAEHQRRPVLTGTERPETRTDSFVGP